MAIAPIEHFARTPRPADSACAALTDWARDLDLHDRPLSGPEALQVIIDVEHASRVVDHLQILAARLAGEHYAAAAEFESHPSSHPSSGMASLLARAEQAVRMDTGSPQRADTPPSDARSFDTTSPGDASSVAESAREALPTTASSAAASLSGAAPVGSRRAGWAAIMDGGFRNCADFLRATLGISRAEARRRLWLAEVLLPGISPTGAPLPPRRETVGAATGACLVSAQAATIVCQALQRVESFAAPHQLDAMEHHLTQQAIESDEDILRVLARRWEDMLDQDGSEPSDKVLHARQGVFLKGRRHGLHVLEIGATDEQYEHLSTVMNTTTNPRVLQGQSGDAKATGSTGAADGTCAGGRPGPNASPDSDPGADSGADSGSDHGSDLGAGLHGRHDGPTRAQALLDGLVTACRIALTTTGLPATGGHRPQVMVTIDYKDLIGDLQHVKRPGHAGDLGHAGDPGQAGHAGHAGEISQGGHAGHAGQISQAGHTGHAGYGVFSEQISARTIRTLACDADLIPLVLGSSGQVLDIGRAQRLFPPHLRRALVARDKGCAFPDCTIPASWCEAHHITPWSRGGGTDINNGVLLCTRHHHVIHQGLWTVEPRNGIPWFHAPGNPGRAGTPRQNTYRQAGRMLYDKRPDQTISYTHTDPDPRR